MYQHVFKWAVHQDQPSKKINISCAATSLFTTTNRSYSCTCCTIATFTRPNLHFFFSLARKKMKMRNGERRRRWKGEKRWERREKMGEKRKGCERREKDVRKEKNGEKGEGKTVYLCKKVLYHPSDILHGLGHS